MFRPASKLPVLLIIGVTFCFVSGGGGGARTAFRSKPFFQSKFLATLLAFPILKTSHEGRKKFGEGFSFLPFTFTAKLPTKDVGNIATKPGKFSVKCFCKGASTQGQRGIKAATSLLIA